MSGMENSVAPLLTLKIVAIVVLALGVHAVSSSDPLYGSNIDIASPAMISLEQ